MGGGRGGHGLGFSQVNPLSSNQVVGDLSYMALENLLQQVSW